MTGKPFERSRSRADSGDDRPYIEATAVVQVRFHEVDVMGIVWHGNYVGYFEEARREFGRKYGIDYPLLVKHRLAAPVVSVRSEYHSPARMGDVLEVTARLYKSESVKLEFGYEIRQKSDLRLVVTGATVQVLTTPDHELILTWPPFLQELLRKWESEWILP